MQVAEIFLNGNHIYTNYGGYLPFYIPIDELIDYTNQIQLLLSLIMRTIHRCRPENLLMTLILTSLVVFTVMFVFIVKDKLHISDPIGANRVAGGGISVSFQDVTNQKATILVQVDAENQYPDNKEAEVKLHPS
jgi:beta-galactosidase